MVRSLERPESADFADVVRPLIAEQTGSLSPTFVGLMKAFKRDVIHATARYLSRLDLELIPSPPAALQRHHHVMMLKQIPQVVGLGAQGLELRDMLRECLSPGAPRREALTLAPSRAPLILTGDEAPSPSPAEHPQEDTSMDETPPGSGGRPGDVNTPVAPKF